MRLVIVGDALLDRDLLGSVGRVCPDAPVPVLDMAELRDRAGGAGLAATLAAATAEVTLIAAPGSGEAADRLRELLAGAGVGLVELPAAGTTPEKVRVRAAGQSLLRIDRGGSTPHRGPLPAAADEALRGADAVLVSDYGRGVATLARLRHVLDELGHRTPLVWDPHPRGPLPVSSTWLASPNAAEARQAAPDVLGDDLAAHSERARRFLARFGGRAVVVTRGAEGALLVSPPGAPLVVSATPLAGGDPCGAGDAFAVAATLSLAGRKATIGEAVEAAVERAGRFVAAGGAAGVPHASRATGSPTDHGTLAGNATAAGSGYPIAADSGSPTGSGTRPRAAPRPAGRGVIAAAAAAELIRATQATGGTVVATGGCFDLLHAGHVRLLADARRLGDLLVVLLNGDASVTRLKGPGRPLQRAGDRADVLAALGVVDAVVVFEEDTPVPLLRQLRPNVFAKGADYATTDLPETEAMRLWGGQVVILPYLSGRSTTRLVEASRDQ